MAFNGHAGLDGAGKVAGVSVVALRTGTGSAAAGELGLVAEPGRVHAGLEARLDSELESQSVADVIASGDLKSAARTAVTRVAADGLRSRGRGRERSGERRGARRRKRRKGALGRRRRSTEQLSAVGRLGVVILVER